MLPPGSLESVHKTFYYHITNVAFFVLKWQDTNGKGKKSRLKLGKKVWKGQHHKHWLFPWSPLSFLSKYWQNPGERGRPPDNLSIRRRLAETMGEKVALPWCFPFHFPQNVLNSWENSTLNITIENPGVQFLYTENLASEPGEYNLMYNGTAGFPMTLFLFVSFKRWLIRRGGESIFPQN